MSNMEVQHGGPTLWSHMVKLLFVRVRIRIPPSFSLFSLSLSLFEFFHASSCHSTTSFGHEVVVMTRTSFWTRPSCAS